MLKLAETTKVFIAEKPVDMRKAINSLATLVCYFFETPVNDGSVYVFNNKDFDRIKCLFWDKNGFVLYHKRLERFRSATKIMQTITIHVVSSITLIDELETEAPQISSTDIASYLQSRRNQSLIMVLKCKQEITSPFAFEL